MASAPASPSSSARLSAVLDQVQLIGIPGEPLDAVLDSVRAQLDALSPAEVASIAVMLLDGTSEANVPSRKERCRLISYSAIIHGRGLYPHLPPLLRSLVSCLDSTEEVREELLRLVGNLARYTLAPLASEDQPQLTGGMMVLMRPLLTGATLSQTGSTRHSACFRAMNRVLVEMPRESSRETSNLLLTTQALLHILAEQREKPSRDQLLPLVRLVQLLDHMLPETETHLIVQRGVEALHSAEAMTRRTATELLLAIGPLLHHRAHDKQYALDLLQLVRDELQLLPETVKRQAAVQDLFDLFEQDMGKNSANAALRDELRAPKTNGFQGNVPHTSMRKSSCNPEEGRAHRLEDDTLLSHPYPRGQSGHTRGQDLYEYAHDLQESTMTEMARLDAAEAALNALLQEASASGGTRADEAWRQASSRSISERRALSAYEESSAHGQSEFVSCDSYAETNCAPQSSRDWQPERAYNYSSPTRSPQAVDGTLCAVASRTPPGAECGLLGAAAALNDAHAVVRDFIEVIASVPQNSPLAFSPSQQRASPMASSPLAQPLLQPSQPTCASYAPYPSVAAPVSPPLPPSPHFGAARQGLSQPQSPPPSTTMPPPSVAQPANTTVSPPSNVVFSPFRSPAPSPDIAVSHHVPSVHPPQRRPANQTARKLFPQAHVKRSPETLPRGADAPSRPSHPSNLAQASYAARTGTSSRAEPRSGLQGSQFLRSQLRRDKAHGSRNLGPPDVQIFVPRLPKLHVLRESVTDIQPAQPQMCFSESACSSEAGAEQLGISARDSPPSEAAENPQPLHSSKNNFACGQNVEDLIEKFQPEFSEDLRFAERKLNQSIRGGTSPPQEFTASTHDRTLRAERALAILLAQRTREIEMKHQKGYERACKQLHESYRHHVAKLQTVYVQQIAELGAAAQRNIHQELVALHAVVQGAPTSPA